MNTLKLQEDRIEYLDVLLDDPCDFFVKEDGQIFKFIADGQGDSEKVAVEVSPYQWNEEMIGDTDGFNVDAFEAELNYQAPGIFERKDSVSPSANQGEFLQDHMDKIWNEALETICNA